MPLLTLSLILFLIMDPLGHVKAFVKALEGIEPKRQKMIIWRELFIALGVSLFFNFVGEWIFILLKISDVTVYLSSGIILFLVAIKILFPRPQDEREPIEGEPFIVPFAIPMIAGPGLLATIMLYAQSEPKWSTSFFAIIIAWAVASMIMVNSKNLLRLLGTRGLTACERLMGMVLVLLAVQRFLQGILLLYTSGFSG